MRVPEVSASSTVMRAAYHGGRPRTALTMPDARRSLTGHMRGAVPYALGWILLAAVYVAIATASGAPPGQAVRITLAVVLPQSLLGLLVIRTPAVLPWPEERRARFFALQAACVLAYVVLGTGSWMALVALDQR